MRFAYTSAIVLCFLGALTNDSMVSVIAKTEDVVDNNTDTVFDSTKPKATEDKNEDAEEVPVGAKPGQEDGTEGAENTGAGAENKAGETTEEKKQEEAEEEEKEEKIREKLEEIEAKEEEEKKRKE